MSGQGREEEGESLGERIRRVRSARGLSLAQVAGGDFSRAFLHQVETGRSQPSTRVLRVIAGRLGTPLDYLLEGPEVVERQLALERARLALARGDAERSLLLSAEAASGADAGAVEVRLLRARALLRLGRDAEAAALLDVDATAAAGLDAALHERLGERARREGRNEVALAHVRAARVLREAGRD